MIYICNLRDDMTASNGDHIHEIVIVIKAAAFLTTLASFTNMDWF